MTHKWDFNNTTLGQRGPECNGNEGVLKTFQSSRTLRCSLVSYSLWPTDKTLIGTTTPGLKGRKSNGNEGAFHIPLNFRTEASSSDDLVLYWGHVLAGVVLHLCRNAVGIFYSASQQGYIVIWLQVFQSNTNNLHKFVSSIYKVSSN